MIDTLATQGWRKFACDEQLLDWVDHVRPIAQRLVAQDDLRSGGTWAAGVNLLSNDGRGQVDDGPTLRCAALAYLRETYGQLSLDSGQLSTCYPGYPQRDGAESEARFRFRRDRDAAHLDGLLPIGADHRRYLREFHGWLLGIPLTQFSVGAAPFVVYEGSHEVIRAAFRAALPHDASDWPDFDLTDAYLAARRTVFETCKRVEIHAQPGEAYVMHRLAIHGIAPWAAGATAQPAGRMIAYFRPEIQNRKMWLESP